jgi:hypothetical protein
MPVTDQLVLFVNVWLAPDASTPHLHGLAGGWFPPRYRDWL